MTENETRLFNTITQNDSEAAKNLIQNGGINLNVKDELGYTVLHRSVIKGNLDLVTLFITHNKDLINIRDNAGRTAAHWAVFIDQSPLQKHCIDILNSLISQGANLTIQDSKGHTVLHKAALTDNLALVKLFIEHDKNLINIPDNNGQTAVYLAAFNINSSQNANSKEIVKLLIQNDANLEILNKFNQSTTDILIENQYEELLALAFQQAESRNNPPVIPKVDGHLVKEITGIEISAPTETVIINTTCNQDDASRPIDIKDEPEAITYPEPYQEPVSLWSKIFSLSWLKSLWSSNVPNRETTFQDEASRPIEIKDEPEAITYHEAHQEPVSLWNKIFSFKWLTSLWSSESVADQIQLTVIPLQTIGDDAHLTSTTTLSGDNTLLPSEYLLSIKN